MNKEYDIVIVGAGPAGSIAARFAAQLGVSVLVLEKDREVGYPVRCGEAIGKPGLEEFMTPDDRWINARIEKLALCAPDGSSCVVEFPQKAYVLERKIFDFALAKTAAAAGAEIVTKSYVTGLLFDDSRVAGVKVNHRGEELSVRAKVVIGADGVESRVGRWAGLTTHADFRDMESCAQYTVADAEFEQDTCSFYFGSEVAPTGYLWIFPKGKGTANIGLGVGGAIGKKRSALSFLNEFMQKRYPNASILTSTCGGVPCIPTLEKISAPGIMLAGDAAHQVNPLSGGGIASAMVAGKLAGTLAAESVKQKNPAHIFAYDAAWRERMGKRHEVYNRLKLGIYDFSDQFFNNLTATVNRIPYEKRTMGKVFTSALLHKPSLLVDVAKVFVI